MGLPAVRQAPDVRHLPCAIRICVSVGDTMSFGGDSKKQVGIGTAPFTLVKMQLASLDGGNYVPEFWLTFSTPFPRF